MDATQHGLCSPVVGTRCWCGVGVGSTFASRQASWVCTEGWAWLSVLVLDKPPSPFIDSVGPDKALILQVNHPI
ncbi:hypothetical protein V6N13_095012 [Hibiscus sabdariffa]